MYDHPEPIRKQSHQDLIEQRAWKKKVRRSAKAKKRVEAIKEVEAFIVAPYRPDGEDPHRDPEGGCGAV